MHPAGVLHRGRRNGAHPVHIERRKGLQIGLDSGAAAAVGAGDRECAGNRPHRGRFPDRPLPVRSRKSRRRASANTSMVLQ